MKSYLLDAILCDWNLMVSMGQIETAEILGALEGIQGFLYVKQEVCIFMCLSIQGTIVDAQTQTATMLVNQYHCQCIRA